MNTQMIFYTPAEIIRGKVTRTGKKVNKVVFKWNTLPVLCFGKSIGIKQEPVPAFYRYFDLLKFLVIKKSKNFSMGFEGVHLASITVDPVYGVVARTGHDKIHLVKIKIRVASRDKIICNKVLYGPVNI